MVSREKRWWRNRAYKLNKAIVLVDSFYLPENNSVNSLYEALRDYDSNAVKVLNELMDFQQLDKEVFELVFQRWRAEFQTIIPNPQHPDCVKAQNGKQKMPKAIKSGSNPAVMDGIKKNTHGTPGGKIATKALNRDSEKRLQKTERAYEL